MFGPQPYGRPPILSSRDTSFLNLFRGLAALYVLMAHCGIFGGAGLLPEPRIAVDLFMILSGFLMMYTVDRSASGWRGFYIKRFFRLAPAYYFSLFLAVALTEPFLSGYWTFMDLNPAAWPAERFMPEFTLTNILLHLTFLFGLFPQYAFSTALPDWSIGLEMQFYAVFPLLYLASRRFPIVWLALLLAAGTIAMTWFYARGVAVGMLQPFPHPSLLIFKLPVFLAGMLIYKGRPHQILAAIAILAAASTGYGWFAPAPCALGIVIAWCWMGPLPALATTFIRSRAVTFLADCSYSVYLLHGFVLSMIGSRVFVALLTEGFSRLAAVAVMTLLVIAVTYPVSWAIYRLIERPGILLSRRILVAMRSERSNTKPALPPNEPVSRA